MGAGGVRLGDRNANLSFRGLILPSHRKRNWSYYTEWEVVQILVFHSHSEFTRTGNSGKWLQPQCSSAQVANKQRNVTAKPDFFWDTSQNFTVERSAILLHFGGRKGFKPRAENGLF